MTLDRKSFAKLTKVKPYFYRPQGFSNENK